MPQPNPVSLAEKLHALGKQECYSMQMRAEGHFEKYPAKQHARRVRDRLDVAEGLVYLPGAPARNNEDSDMPAPFRQRRYFYYLSGCNEPNCYLTYDIQHDILTLFIPRIDESRVIWNGRGSTPAEAMDKYDIDEVYYIDELQRQLLEWQLRYSGSLYVLHREQIPRSPHRHKSLDTTSLLPAMNLCRMIKDEHEINLIRQANDISSEAHRKVLAKISSFKNEAQVEGLFLDVCVSRQAKQQAYDPIAASGPNAGTLHYDANNEDFGDRQLMCLDAGCEFELYASDITRTFPLSGSWPSVESENIYKLVQRMQESCIKRLAPGVRYLDLHILAHQIAIDGLLKLGILHNGTSEEIYKAGTSRAFFPHGLGHHVGLEVHDVGQKELMSLYDANANFEKAPSLYPEDFHLPVYDNEMCRAPTNPESPHLEEGMVVTVEPGIYFSTYALTKFYFPSPTHSKYINKEVVEKYLPVGGVRIEDDILITSKGYENLTTAPKGDDMLAMIRAQNHKLPYLLPPGTGPGDKNATVTVDNLLFRAPGIPKNMSGPPIKPLSLSKASTMPLPSRTSVDFEPFRGPSLFAGFTDHREREESSTVPQKLPVPFREKRPVVTHRDLPAASQSNRLPPIGILSSEMDRHSRLPKTAFPVVSEKQPEMQQTLPPNPKTRHESSVPPKFDRCIYPYPVARAHVNSSPPQSSMPPMMRLSETRTETARAQANPLPRRSVTLDDHVAARRSFNPWEHSVPRDSHASSHPPRYPPRQRASIQDLQAGRPPRLASLRHIPEDPILPPQHPRHNQEQYIASNPTTRTNHHVPHPSISEPHATHATYDATPAFHHHRSLQLLRSGNPYRDSVLSSHESGRASSRLPPMYTGPVHIPAGRNEESPPRSPPSTARDQEIEDLRRAMNEVWRIQEDAKRACSEVMHRYS
ncbi:hypothetical protein DM02DRAFT_630847 [Periconia macrospinosa]|uniref:Xaa-Pro aminopeptidase n=1 Tax=Periconia macrospinosa TaxID=97972 RepID=A0A2V1DJE8_9PLEO|nr:hypothetical protein DM02DRAFT_630847 [Periconia macrospinosa]